MKIIIMKCSGKNLWYENKIGKVYKVNREYASNYLTNGGSINKEDCEVIG